MEICRTVTQLKSAIAARRDRGDVGFVPTMGALHAGHASLIERCTKENATTVVSVFVNPTQFNDPDDLKNYPRTEAADLAILEDKGCDIAFLPSVEQIYPEPDTRVFDFGTIGSVMEGEHRPGHFNGVAQVVSRLFDMVEPDKAYFGEKDFQQIAIIRSMCRQTGSKVTIVDCPIKREDDGLAMSSRNTLLSPEQRAAAPAIHMTLAASVARKEWADVEETKKWVIEQIDSNELMKVEYYDIVDASTLQSIDSWNHEGAVYGCIAVQVGRVRLIDNIKYK